MLISKPDIGQIACRPPEAMLKATFDDLCLRQEIVKRDRQKVLISLLYRLLKSFMQMKPRQTLGGFKLSRMILPASHGEWHADATIG